MGKSGLIGDANLIIGIVTPFRRQMELIEEIIQNTWLNTFKDNITVGTAHKFQVTRLILFSFLQWFSRHPPTQGTVGSKTDQLLNVALTRARVHFTWSGITKHALSQDPSPNC